MRGRQWWLIAIVGAGLLAGAPASDAAGRWPGTRITYSNTTTKPRLVAEAIRRWNAATGLRIVRARRGERAQIRIQPRFDGCPAGVGACAYYPPDGRVQMGRRWRSGPRALPDEPRTSTQELDLLIHELGHALGLDHVGTGCSVMRVYIGDWARDCARLAGREGSGIYPCAPFPSDARTIARRYGIRSRARTAGRCVVPKPRVALVAPRDAITLREQDLDASPTGRTIAVRIRNTGTWAWTSWPQYVELRPVDARGRPGGPCFDQQQLVPERLPVRPRGIATVRMQICTPADGSGQDVRGPITYRLRPETAGWGVRYGTPLVVRVAIDRAPTAYALEASRTDGPGGTAVTFGAEIVEDGAVALLWDFGDPASGAADASTATSPQHLYATPGTYLVRLRVTDASGQTATAETSVFIPEA